MKTKQVLKAILAGVAVGAVIFFIPFPFRFFFVFFFIFFALRIFYWRKRGRYWNAKFGEQYFWNPSYTQRWRSLSNEERKSLIQKMEKELFATQPINEEIK